MKHLIYLVCMVTVLTVTAAGGRDEQQEAVAESGGRTPGAKPTPPIDIAHIEQPESIVAVPDVYPIRARGWSSESRQAIYPDAVAVAVGGKLYGPGHLVDKMSGTPIVEVQIGDRWQQVTWQRDAKRDLMTITLDGVAGGESRSPVYGERVIVHAHATDAAMCGTVFSIDPLYVGLDPSEQGIKSGDSGSPIVSESGDLIGIVTGFRASPGTGEPRSVVGEPIATIQAAVAPAVASPAVVPLLQPGTNSQCPGGICPSPSYQYYQPQRRGLFRWR